MPNVKDYNGKKKHTSKRRPHSEHHNEHMEAHMEAQDDTMEEAHETVEQSEVLMNDAGDIGADAEAMLEESDAINTEAQNEGVHADAHYENAEDTFENPEEPSKVHLNFVGSEIIRQKAPKVMELADTVADEWVKDGQFEGLPVGNPLAQMAAAKALRTAKDVEKKLEEKGVFAMAKMGLDYAKSKIQKKH